MYRLIAVPLDGTAESRQALPWAITIARASSSPVEIVRAFPPLHGSELYGGAVLDPDEIRQLELEAEREHRAVTDEVEAIGVKATSIVLHGQAPAVLSDHLREGDADLVVMTTHDRGRLESLLVGSVSASVVRRAHVPTLLIRAAEGDVPPLTERKTIERILVPLDGSMFADAIVPHATRLAETMRSRIMLIGVVEPILAATAVAAGPIGAAAGAVAPLIPADEGDDARAELQSRELERVAERLRAHSVPVETAVLVHGQPARAILDYAKHHDVDVIAMTTHGRGALERLVAGSVSSQVLRKASTPLLMYRPEHIAD